MQTAQAHQAPPEVTAACKEEQLCACTNEHNFSLSKPIALQSMALADKVQYTIKNNFYKLLKKKKTPIGHKPLTPTPMAVLMQMCWSGKVLQKSHLRAPSVPGEHRPRAAAVRSYCHMYYTAQIKTQLLTELFLSYAWGQNLSSSESESAPPPTCYVTSKENCLSYWKYSV